MDGITINRSKESVLEFELRVDGASVEEAEARFIIHFDQYNVYFPCSMVSQNLFTSKVPAVPFLSKGVQDCSIEVIINGQIFKPLKSVVTIVDNITVTAAPVDDNKEVRGEEGEEQEETVVPTLVKKDVNTGMSLVSRLKYRNAAEEEEVSEGVKDKQVRAILESMNLISPITTKKKRKSPSLKSLTETKKLTK